jgi:hypothetical protein
MHAPDRAAEVATSSSGGIFDGERGDHNDYLARTQQHAPKTRQEIEAAARELAARGFSDHAVAAILKMDVTGIRRILGEPKT